MVSFKSFLLLGAIAFAATVPQVITDITNLDNNVKSLITATSAYNGGLIAASPQLFSLIPVYASLLKGVTDTRGSSPPLSPSQKPTRSSTTELYSKAGLSDGIVAALGLLKLGHEAFTKNVVERVPESTLADGTAVALVISNALQKGIDYFEAS
ncbi:hypothetical protein BKA65DRAFT_555939 [Rhexocercosporidium sp. MPI-PUGE-AT-0058]|nr:hypothetical protein BKA65DRAFT_555939 [Rhexocercosporidium sp. MPI-PUGE-AT-0058]